MSEKIALTTELADEFKNYFRTQRKQNIAICQRAFLASQQWVDNLDGERWKYAKEFTKWFNDNELSKYFISINGFQRMARCGYAIHKAVNRFDGDLEQMPVSIAALEEVAKLSDTELRMCLETTYKRKSVTEPEQEWSRPKKAKPLIKPSATAAQISNWRKNWQNPPAPKTEKRTVSTHQIYVHGSIYDIDKTTHKPTGAMTAEKLDALNDAIVSAVQKLNLENLIRVVPSVSKIKEGITRRILDSVKSAEKAKQKAQASAAKKPKKKSPKAKK